MRQDFRHPNNIGSLPIRALQFSVISEFQNVHPGFLQDIQDEVEYNGLQKGITYDDSPEPIMDMASLSPDKKISINEPYLAFLWCFSYLTLTLYKERDKPFKNNHNVSRAGIMFDYGRSLFQKWSEWKYSLPNPEIYDPQEDPYIEQTNGIMILATCFILCHEFGHQFYQHDFDWTLEKEAQFKKEELDADEFAAETMLKGMGEAGDDKDNSIRYGIIAGIGSTLFANSNWTGGSQHPDTDERLTRVLEIVSLSEEDEIWLFATMILVVWAVAFNLNTTEFDRQLETMKGRNTPKEKYLLSVEHFRRLQQQTL